MDLKEYFTNHWPKSRVGLESYTHTGYNLLQHLKPNERVLDVGCGTNPFKEFLGDRVHGIDITDIGSDEQIAIEDYKTDDKFDVAFVLGSINFGTEDVVRRQIQSVVDALKDDSRIYWRCNPGYHDHGNEQVNEINFFPWSLQYLIEFSKEFGYTIIDFALDGNDGHRIYCVWKKGK